MSWYYDYYICRKNKEDGKLYPLGPFNYNGKFFCVLSRSRSFASDLHEKFWDIRTAKVRQMISEELLKSIHVKITDERSKEFYEGNGNYYWSYLPYKDLPCGDYIKKGYCLIDDIESYENEECYFDGFYDWLSPEIYAKKLENELKFGAPMTVKDDAGTEYKPHSMRDYSFYRWIDYESSAYEAHVIRSALETIKDIDNDDEIFIVLVQG